MYQKHRLFAFDCSSSHPRHDTRNGGIHLSYQYEEEEGKFEWVLEQDDVNEDEDDPRPVKPEVIIRRLDDYVSFDSHVLLGDLMGQLVYYVLELRPHCQ